MLYLLTTKWTVSALPEKTSLCWEEQLCHGWSVKGFVWSYGLDTALYRNLPFTWWLNGWNVLSLCHLCVTVSPVCHWVICVSPVSLCHLCVTVLPVCSRYLVHLETRGDPAWECLVNMQQWLSSLLLDCKDQHLTRGTTCPPMYLEERQRWIISPHTLFFFKTQILFLFKRIKKTAIPGLHLLMIRVIVYTTKINL